jgi:hypothetical protein
MVPLHGLKKLRGRFQILLPKRKEVAQSAPDLQMVMGRGQIERESWQGEMSGLGTLSPGPTPLPPLMDSLLHLALPFLEAGPLAFPADLERLKDLLFFLGAFFFQLFPSWESEVRGLE